MQALMINELNGDTTTDDVYVVSKAYLIERDETDLEIFKAIEKQNIK
jgi:hypothetical protein